LPTTLEKFTTVIILSYNDFLLTFHIQQFKAKGNAAMQANKISEAIEFYTKAINLDGANHVYFSNRSAAYLSQGDAQNALDDANSCLGLKPDFSKGYSRKGAALHSLKRYNDSIAAYEEGLKRFPGDPGLTKGLEDVKREKADPFGTASSSSAGMGAGGLFGPQMMAQMALNPRLRPYLSDPDVMSKIKMVQQNPNMLPTILQDAKMMELLGVMMGKDGEEEEESSGFSPSSREPQKAADSTKPSEPEPEPMEEEEEDLTLLTPEEREEKERLKAAKKKKEEGNDLYKAQKFEEALAAYDEAISLDSTNMTYLSNKAAVYFTQKKFDECIEACMSALEVGKAHRAPFEDRAKALTRAAKAYQKKGDLAKAIELCEQAQLESFDKTTQRLLKTMELDKKKADAAAYLSDEKAEEAKQRGNDYFRDKDWVSAVREYEEAVKRAPKNAVIRNNLAAALCKIMDFSGAQRQIETALDIDPQYVKAWARKGDIEMYMKEYHKAQESYKKGLALDPENAACKEGLQKVMMAISYGRQNMTDEEKKEQAAHAMADPEIQGILQDPVMQQVLKDLQENPAAGQQALRDPIMRSKLEKLIAAGIIETR
jgi:stress-induced-phosphoprotein 1